MKKLLPLIILVLIVGGAWFFSRGSGSAPGSSTGGPAGSAGVVGSGEGQADGGTTSGGAGTDGTRGDDAMFDGDGDTRPAAEMYKTLEDALRAVKDGAGQYDDIVLEQFTLPGEDCSWCPAFYASVKELLLDPATPQDQQSYYAEILAISGRVENLQTLADAVTNAPNKETADLYAEALELTVGGDEVVKFLGEQMGATNETLREAAVAGMTNQGSRLALELLYKNTVERGDPDGYYSLGIGLGESVPEEEALPYVQELALKRDQYSSLAVKSMINAGLPGLKLVFDMLTNSKDPEFDRGMLKDAVDHVNYDEETEAFLKKASESPNQPLVAEFAKQILEDFNVDEQSEEPAEE